MGVVQAFDQKNDLAGPAKFYEELRSTLGRPEPRLLSGDILAYYYSSQFTKGSDIFQKCMSKLPRWPGCSMVGVPTGGTGNFPIRRVQGILAIDPADESARFSLGRFYASIQKPDEAAKAYHLLLAG